MTEEQVRAIVREEMRGERSCVSSETNIRDPLKASVKHPRMSIAMNYDDEGRPLFEVDGKVVGPADGVLQLLLSWKRTEGGKAVWDQIDAFSAAFVRL